MKRTIYLALCILLVGMGLPVIVKATGTSRADNIKSKGIINYQDKVIVNSSDFVYLADEIDNLENAYKENTVAALNGIGTYFKSDGSVTWDASESEIAGSDSSTLKFGDLQDGILNSQSVESTESSQASNSSGLLFFKDETANEEHNLTNVTNEDTGYPVYFASATSSNLTAGAAAWVDGHLIIGNSSDVDDAYNRGVTDGLAQAVTGVDISYVYHTHAGSAQTKDGCYKAVYHVHNGCRYDQHACACPTDNGAGACWNCGHPGYHSAAYPCSAGDGVFVWSCGKTTSTIEGYGIGCGKTTSTIESATIVYP